LLNIVPIHDALTIEMIAGNVFNIARSDQAERLGRLHVCECLGREGGRKSRKEEVKEGQKVAKGRNAMCFGIM
jgi:hypothetical protein